MLKIKKYFLFASLLGSGSLALPPMLAFAQQPTEAQSIVRFTPSTGDYRGTTFERVIAPGGAVPFTGKYRLKTRVALQQEPVQQVVETLDLNWAPPAGVPPDGWLQSEGSWRWAPGPQNSFIGFPIALPSQSTGQQAPAISDFDEMWLDYRDRGGSDNCDLSFTADAHASAARKSAATVRIKGGKASVNSANWHPALRVQAADAAWLPMDNLYLAKRILGMELDTAWRYREVGKHTLVQRRFHHNLDGIEALDFLFTPETDVQFINLRIAHGSWLRPDSVIGWDAIPRQIESAPDGSMRVRLLIGEWLRQNDKAGDGSQKFFLSEAVVFLKGEVNELAQSKPLREVVFFTNEIDRASVPSTKPLVSLPARSESLAPGYKRWILDLRPLSHGKWFDVRMKSALLAIHPSDPDRQCALQPLALRLVRVASGKEPSYIADTRRLLRRLGGPFNAVDPERKEVEWAQTDAYMPLSLLPAASYANDKRMGVQRLDLPEWGLRFLAAGEWIAQQSPQGLSFKGQGGRIEISWELPSIATQASSTLFLRVLEDAKHISAGKARIDFNDGSSSTINFLPNRPVPLGAAAAGKRVTGITLDLETNNSPATLVMQELALFRPFLISQTDSFSARRPAWEFLPLRVATDNERKVQIPALGELVVHGTAQPDPALPNIWRTPVNVAAKNLIAVKVRHALSELPREPCWLTLRARTANKQVPLTLCPAGTEGELIQPLAQLAKEFGAEDTVLDFEWEANPSHAAVPLTFDIQAQLGSSSLPSMRELLAQNVSVKVGRQSYLPLAIQSADMNDFSSRGSGWLDFGEINLLAGQNPDVDPAVSHPYVQVQKLMLEDDRPLTAADMSRLYPSENRESAWPYRIIKLALMLALGAVAWLLWRRGVWQKTWKALWSRTFGPEKYLGGLVGKLWLRVVAVRTSVARAVPPVAVFMIFSAATLVLYAYGLLLRNEQGENYFFTFGGILAVFSWRALLRYARERIFRAFPTLADKIYGGKGTIYFTGALVGLLVIAGLLAFNYAPVAEQVAVVVYYFLVTGTVLEIVEMHRASKAANGLPGFTDQNKAN